MFRRIELIHDWQTRNAAGELEPFRAKSGIMGWGVLAVFDVWVKMNSPAVQ